jgi:hypothetical protein
MFLLQRILAVGSGTVECCHHTPRYGQPSPKLGFLCPFQTEKKGQLSTLWRVLPKFILWKIWLERNKRLFRELKRSPTQVATKIQAYFAESAPYFCQTKNSSVLELEEEQWLVQFKIQDQGGKKDNSSGQEAWEI